MAESKAPAYQWYPKDHRSDERVELMDLEQEGALRRLLDHQWMNGSIPADPDDLASLLRVDRERFDRIWKRVGPCFESVDGDPSRLANARMERERAARDEFIENRRAAGSKGAAERWAKQKPAISSCEPQPLNGHASTNGKQMAKPKQSDSTAIVEPMAKNASASATASAITEASASGATAPVPESSEPGEWETPPFKVDPFKAAEDVLTQVHQSLGWDPPLSKDVRRRLRADDALQVLIGQFGIDDTAKLFVFAAREWQGRVSWEAVLDKRFILREQMGLGTGIDSSASNGRRRAMTEQELEELIGHGD